ncbi:Crp/Fnr family transcriptional regulator [Sphingobacterium bovistauri]|uniref:Crp/Fnr family transcriptional regulator n=1 Tax=Sphingobacterium bovistauri TaxID=2781959 RepID=A0ABS7Z0F6_9SPHI|nr:Crp/Fnr family transcriptional regulator [Sphingobacterium bovistauri]MCA5003651.1 Crp/Fnr family transcriptional regulator [Sphingobacterium bovistauri]
MFDNFRKYLSDKGEFSISDFDYIESFASIKKLRKKQYLLQEGDVWKHLAFVSTGLLRSYYVDTKGYEHIMQFASENHWTGDRESLITGITSKFNIEAIEASEVILFKNVDFIKLRNEIPALNDFVSRITNKNVLALEERIYANITLSAEEKYLNFLKQHPHISNRIPQHMIASYIGISPETLSRIRSNTTKK